MARYPVDKCTCLTQRPQLYIIAAHQILEYVIANLECFGVDFKVIEIAYHMYLIVA